MLKKNISLELITIVFLPFKVYTTIVTTKLICIKDDNTVTCHLGTHSENSAKVRTEQAERT